VQRGQLRQDAVLADVGVLRPGRIGRGRRWCGRGGTGRRACNLTRRIPFAARSPRRPAAPPAGTAAARAPSGRRVAPGRGQRWSPARR
jgi:hypothetical protein